MYEGYWKNGKSKGKGAYIDELGDFYEVELENDKSEDIGYWSYANWNFDKGGWEENEIL